jgi:hypothetical protein
MIELLALSSRLTAAETGVVSAPPLASVDRKGSSSVTGLAATTVFCWQVPVNTGAGAPCTPE